MKQAMIRHKVSEVHVDWVEHMLVDGTLIDSHGETTIEDKPVNLLMPNVNYSGRTAPLTSKVTFYIFIQQIKVLNILNMVYTLRSFLFKMQFVS